MQYTHFNTRPHYRKQCLLFTHCSTLPWLAKPISYRTCSCLQAKTVIQAGGSKPSFSALINTKPYGYYGFHLECIWFVHTFIFLVGKFFMIYM